MNDKKNPILKDHIDLNPFLAREAMSSKSEKKGMKKVAKKIGMGNKLDTLLSGTGCNALTKDQCDKSFFCDYDDEEKVCEKSEELEEFIELNELQRRLNKSVLDAYVLISRRVIERECTPDPNVSREYQKFPYLCRPCESFEKFKNKQEDKSLYDNDYLDYDVRDLLEVVDYVVPDEGLPHNLGYLHDKQTLLEEFKIDGECIILGKKDKELLLYVSSLIREKEELIGGGENDVSRYRKMNYSKLKEQILLDINSNDYLSSSEEDKDKLLLNFKMCSDEKIRGRIKRFADNSEGGEFSTREMIENKLGRRIKPSQKQLVFVEIEINSKKFEVLCASTDLRVLGKLPSHLETIPKPIRILIAATLALTYNKNKDRDIKIGKGVNLMKKVLVPLSGGLFEVFNEMGSDAVTDLEEGIDEGIQGAAQLLEEGEKMTTDEFEALADKHLSSVALGIQKRHGWNPDPLLKQGRPSSLGIITSSQLKSDDPNDYGSSLDFFMNRLCLGLKELMNMINSCNSLHELRELLKTDFFVQLDNEPLYTRDKLQLLNVQDLRRLYYQLNERGFCKFYKDDYQLLREYLFKVRVSDNTDVDTSRDNLKDILRNYINYHSSTYGTGNAKNKLYLDLLNQLLNYSIDGVNLGIEKRPYEILCFIINLAYNKLYSSELLREEDVQKLFDEIGFLVLNDNYGSLSDTNVSANLHMRTEKNNHLAEFLLLQDNVVSDNTECKRLKEISQRLYASVDAVIVETAGDLQLPDLREFFAYESSEILKKLLITEIVSCQLTSDSFEEQQKINEEIHGNVMRLGGESGGYGADVLKMFSLDTYYRGDSGDTIKDRAIKKATTVSLKAKDKVKDKLKMYDFNFDTSEDITPIFEELVAKIDKKNPQMPITEGESQKTVKDVEPSEEDSEEEVEREKVYSPPKKLSSQFNKMVKNSDDVP